MSDTAKPDLLTEDTVKLEPVMDSQTIMNTVADAMQMTESDRLTVDAADTDYESIVNIIIGKYINFANNDTKDYDDQHYYRGYQASFDTYDYENILAPIERLSFDSQTTAPVSKEEGGNMPFSRPAPPNVPEVVARYDNVKRSDSDVAREYLRLYTEMNAARNAAKLDHSKADITELD